MAPPTTTPLTSQHTEPQPLRRATYVHVSDLISVYNIDHVELEREIARVNAKRSKPLAIGADAGVTMRDKVVQDKTDVPFPSSGIVADRTMDGNSDCNSDDVPAPGEGANLEATVGPILPQKRLQPPRGGFNLCVLVGNINLVVDKKRVDQSRVRLAEVEIGDETGTVSLRARDEQIDLLERVRNKRKPRAVVLRNSTLELYQGKHIRLAVTKWGKLTEYPDNVASTPGPPPTMNLDRNFSFIDLSLVASEIAPKKQSDSLPYATSAPTSTTANRQTKKADTRTGRSASSTPKSPTALSKQGQSNIKHNQQQTRRSSRSSNTEQRRQARSTQYGGMKVDSTQPHRTGQMIYHGVQGYHGYGEQNMDMRMRQQYPPHAAYTHSHIHSQPSRQLDNASAQFAIHQQYEMQQRQLHQLYSREQGRQVGQVQQQQPSPMILRHMSSYDVPSGSYAGDLSVASEVGNSPILVAPPDHYTQSSKMENHPGLQQEGPQSTSAYASMGSISPYQIGKMNPEASSFAPSYLSAAQGSSTQQQLTAMPLPPQYSSYTPSQQQQQQQQQPLPSASMYPTLQSAHHPQFYVPASVSPGGYHHTMSQASLNIPLERGPDDKSESALAGSVSTRNHEHYQHPSTTHSTKESAPSSGKENVTSTP